MKKIAVLLLCLSMLSASAVTAYAEEADANTAPGEATIGTVIPDSHKITIKVKGNAVVKVNGKEGTEFEVERLSEPVIEIKAKDGEEITKVTLNGEDITDKIVDGKYILPAVYEDGEYELTVETEKLPDDSSKPDSSNSGSSNDGANDDSVTTPQTGFSASTTGVTVTLTGTIALAAAAVIAAKKKKDE